MERTDRQLVKRLLAGDRRAFRTFFDSHFNRLYRFAMSRLDHDPATSEEIVQSTLSHAVNKLESYRGEGPLFSWLCTFCRHEISAHFKRLGRTPDEVALTEDAPEVRSALDTLALERSDDPESVLRQREFEQSVHEILDRLAPRHGDVLEWKYIQGLPVKEIAERLQIGIKATESVLTRAREAFRKAFEDEPRPSRGTVSRVPAGGRR
jgi:RNA polymerase sigma-70 factor (ECF subfamily)